MITLETRVEEVPKIGPTYAKRLKKLGIQTVRDLLFYFPTRYDDFSKIIPIKQAKQQLGSVVCIQGEIIEIKTTKSWQRAMPITRALVQDKTAQIDVLWFNQPYLEKTLKENDFVCLAGKISLGQEGVYLNSPVHEKINEIGQNEELTHTGRIVPVYSETRGVTSRWLRYIIKPLLYRFCEQIPESLPKEIIKKYKFLPIQETVWQLHFPDSFEHADAAKARLSFEELFLIQLSVLKEKIKVMQKKSLACPMDTGLMKKFANSLPFKLTDSQKKCAFAILKDLEKTTPMSRLLEGDVGSGKTVVATMIMLNVVKGRSRQTQQPPEIRQVAFMVPTEILAKQHFKTITDLLKNFNVKIGLLTSKNSRIFDGKTVLDVSKKSILGDLENGQLDIIIGTHALLQRGVEFQNLVLVIVDEQHRFGVEQRAQLTKKQGLIPHLLSMTATPIPRTLALTIYGDLDLCLIDEMPKNRKKVKTIIVTPQERKQAYEFIKKEVNEGKGVFVICPKIESRNSKIQNQNDETKPKNRGVTPASAFVSQNYSLKSLTALEVKAVKDEYEKLSKEIFPDLKVAMLHGKMKPAEKEKIMLDFKNGKIDILVSTSVVEVGVDVPRATIMMVESAERFGLAQLHQFRGRVGRSDAQSYCFLFTTEPSMLNRKRLRALVDCDNGFKLAEKDLEIRGPGSLYGTQQWGIPDMAMQNLSNIYLVEKTRQAAKELLEKDPELKNYPELKNRLKNFEQRLHFE